MLLSQKCRYAIRGLYELAVRLDEDVVRVSDVAIKQNIPPRFLENIFNELKHAGYVSSKRGQAGGYRLTRPASEITLGEIVRVIDGPLLVSECQSRFRESAGSAELALHPVMEDVRKAIYLVWDGTTLQDLIAGKWSESQGCLEPRS